MDDVRLSPRERRILAEIEEELGRDEPLARRLGTAPGGLRLPDQPAPGTYRLRPALALAALGAATLALLVLAVTTEAPVLIWAFAAAWVLTLVVLLRLVVRWSRRRAGDPRTPG
ncbi:DUF3040 domain-containing protein [Streptomyces sp. NPDC126503]|uniref:DUF3040 domain-containing protein n=1 Tax=Streptomyces sp. NPDC126503 TaxID=3155315 RepID=UPI003316952E